MSIKLLKLEIEIIAKNEISDNHDVKKMDTNSENASMNYHNAAQDGGS